MSNLSKPDGVDDEMWAPVEEALNCVASTWGQVNNGIFNLVTGLAETSRISGREDVMKIFVAEFMEKTIPVNNAVVDYAFGSDRNAKDNLKEKVTELKSTAARYKRGLPTGLGRFLSTKLTPDMINMIKQLETVYINLTLMITNLDFKSEYKDKLLALCAEKSKMSWNAIVDESKVWFNLKPDRIYTVAALKADHHFKHLIDEGMSEEVAFDAAKKLTSKLLAEKDFNSWFDSEDN